MRARRDVVDPVTADRFSRKADPLRDGNLVFGVVVNGQARAYPKRVLAWHEMAIDRLGGVEMTVVYCTLCGTVIPYESVVGDRPVARHRPQARLQRGRRHRDYFSNDRVLVLRVRPAAGGDAQPVAIVADYLKQTPVFHFEVAGRRLLVVTTRQGANRVYALGGSRRRVRVTGVIRPAHRHSRQGVAADRWRSVPPGSGGMRSILRLCYSGKVDD